MQPFPVFRIFSFSLLFAALFSHAVYSGSIGCIDGTPVEQRSCSLNLQPGDQGLFECANPQPPKFPVKIYNWQGEESSVADVLGSNVTITQDKTSAKKYIITVPANAGVAAGGITCSQTARPSSKNPPGVPTQEEASYLEIHSLVIRISEGPKHTRDGYAVVEKSSAVAAGGMGAAAAAVAAVAAATAALLL